MPLHVTSRLEENFGILDLAGSLTLGPSLNGLRETARQVLGSKSLSGMILHVGGVTNIDSSGLGELTVIYTLATKRGCPIRLVEVGPSLHKMLELTRLDGLLPSSQSVAAAKSEMQSRTEK